MLTQNYSTSYILPLAMDYYQTNGDTYALQDMIDVEMEISAEMYHGYQPHDLTKQPMSHSPLSAPSHSSSQDSYGDIPQNRQINYSDGQMQEYKLPASALPLSLKAEPSELDIPISSLNWFLPQQHNGTCNHNIMGNPPSPITNGAQSVPNQSLSSKILSLPNSVQISGGNVNYVSMPSPTQQVYITTTKAAMATHQQPSLTDNINHSYRPRGDSGYMLSPNSLPTSTVADNPYPKPPYSYSCLIAMSLKNSKHGSLPVAEIYNFMIRHFPYFKTAPDGWKNSVRHNLSLNKCFEKIENPNADGTNSRKGCLWALNPAKVKKMDEEIFKWNKKDPMAIKRAMSHPEMLETLSKGQELCLAGNGIKHVSNAIRQPVLHPVLQQHQPLHHMHHHQHHQSQSPHHSPTLGILNNHQSSMMPHTNGHHGAPVMHAHGQLQHKHHMNERATADMYGNGELTLDPLLSEISVQSGIWDDLPNDLLDIPFSHSPTTFLISPKKTSPAPSPAHTNEAPAIPNNMPRGTLISLGQN